MKQGMFKQVLSAMVLTMSLAGGAAFASADSASLRRLMSMEMRR